MTSLFLLIIISSVLVCNRFYMLVAMLCCNFVIQNRDVFVYICIVSIDPINSFSRMQTGLTPFVVTCRFTLFLAHVL